MRNASAWPSSTTTQHVSYDFCDHKDGRPRAARVAPTPSNTMEQLAHDAFQAGQIAQDALASYARSYEYAGAPRHGATIGGTLPFSEHARGSPTLVQQEKEKARILSLKLADSITESEAYAFLRPLVMEGDVAQLSTKKLRQAMEEEFGVPLAHRKQFIDPIVMRILSERRAAEAEAEAKADAAEVAAVLYAVVGAIEAAAEELAAERRAGYRLTRPTWSAAEDETVRRGKRQRSLAPGEFYS